MAVVGARETILRRILDAEDDLPMPPEPLWCEIIQEVVTIALTTHPAALVLLAEAANEAPPRQPPPELMIRDVAKQILHFHPTADFFEVEDAGKAGARIARRRQGDGASPSARETWKHVLWAMYMRVLDPPSLDVFCKEPIAEAIVEGIGAAGDIFEVLDGGSAEERLAEAVRLVRLRMLMVRYDVQVGGGGATPKKDEMH